MKRSFSILFMLLLLSASGRPLTAQEAKRAESSDVPQSPGALVGAGNFDNGSVNKDAEAKFQLLKTVGGTRCRVNLYPSVYLVNNDWERPNPACMDAIMQTAHGYGVTPMILFEFYADYEAKGTLKLGTYEQWFRLGKAFAEHCRPNGTWGHEHGVKDWGITIYTAFNEPDGGDFKAGGAIGPTRYVAALKGLADGVHSVEAPQGVAGRFPVAQRLPGLDAARTRPGAGSALERWHAGRHRPAHLL